MTTLTPEQKRAVEAAGEAPVWIDEPDGYVLLRRDVYDRLVRLESPVFAYSAIDRAFAEGWDDPLMSEYDEYEKHRPFPMP